MENTEIDEYCGTEGWIAPEIGEEDGHVGVFFCVISWKGDVRLSQIAKQLMARDPQQRASPLEWHKWSAAPLSGMTNVLKCRGKESRPR